MKCRAEPPPFVALMRPLSPSLFRARRDDGEGAMLDFAAIIRRAGGELRASPPLSITADYERGVTLMPAGNCSGTRARLARPDALRVNAITRHQREMSLIMPGARSRG